MDERPKSEWFCVNCGRSLGKVHGGEFYPTVESSNIRTSGPNLTVTCPDCKTIKVWYTSDAVVRAVYQLVNALSDVAAQAMVKQIGKAIHTEEFNR